MNNPFAQWQSRPGDNLGAPWLIIRHLEIDLTQQLFWNTKSLLRNIPKIPYILMGYTAQFIVIYEAFVVLWHAIWKRGKRRGWPVIVKWCLHYRYLFLLDCFILILQTISSLGLSIRIRKKYFSLNVISVSLQLDFSCGKFIEVTQIADLVVYKYTYKTNHKTRFRTKC